MSRIREIDIHEEKIPNTEVFEICASVTHRHELT